MGKTWKRDKLLIYVRSEQKYAIAGDELDLLGRIPLNLAISRGIDAAHPLVTGQEATPESQVFRDIAVKLAAKLPMGPSDE